MIPIARGQAIKITTRPPSQVVHACWLNDAVSRIDQGHGNVEEEPAVIAACGDWAALEDIHETDAPIDCMACLVRHERYNRDSDGTE